MEGLRRRLASLFLELCRLPAFNPAAAARPGAAAAGAAAGARQEPETFVYAETERGVARAAPVPVGADVRAW
jgi:hypothetical protein